MRDRSVLAGDAACREVLIRVTIDSHERGVLSPVVDRRRATLFVATAAVLVTAAIAAAVTADSDPSGSRSDATVEPSDLAGDYLGPPHANTRWLTPVQFTDDTVTAYDGCNSLSWAYRIDSNQLILEGPQTSTAVACTSADGTIFPPHTPLLIGVLTTQPRIGTTDEGSVVLTAGDAVIELADAELAEPVQPVMSQWQIFNASALNTSSMPPTPTTLTIDDGEISIVSDCLSGGGSAQVEADTIAVTGFTLDQIEECPDNGHFAVLIELVLAPTGVTQHLEIETTRRGINLHAVDPNQDGQSGARLSLQVPSATVQSD
ncbi:MAG: hypothetical protein AAGF73_04430 [Actinomycetota bacterium]